MRIQIKLLLLFALVIISGTAAMGGFAVYTMRTVVLEMLGEAVDQALFDQVLTDFSWKIVIFGALGLLVAILASWIVAARSARPLVELTKVTNRVANGDLTVPTLQVTSRDELGQLTGAVNGMIHSLRNLISGANKTIIEVSGASDQLTENVSQTTLTARSVFQTFEDLTTGVKNHARGALESAKAVEEMASGIQKVAENAGTVSESAYTMNKQVESGHSYVRSATQSINSLVESLRIISEIAGRLNDRSKEINEIAQWITRISSQTNILALNASIEASRSGEHGKGFVVIAQEVRKLADDSKGSAEKITDLIQEIEELTTQSVESIQAGVGQLDIGVSCIKEAGQALEHIRHASRHVTEQIHEVSAASEQLSAGTEQVAASMDEMARISEATESRVKQVEDAFTQQMQLAEASQSMTVALHQLSQELKQVIKGFKL